MIYTFIRNNPNDPNRKVIQEDYEYMIRDCFSMCSAEVRARLESFFADPQQESVTFEFDNGETVEIRRE